MVALLWGYGHLIGCIAAAIHHDGQKLTCISVLHILLNGKPLVDCILKEDINVSAHIGSCLGHYRK